MKRLTKWSNFGLPFSAYYGLDKAIYAGYYDRNLQILTEAVKIPRSLDGIADAGTVPIMEDDEKIQNPKTVEHIFDLYESYFKSKV